ncbi:MAG TPA: hypothetical protein VNL35_21280 [Chloroflexota bacterium]|nr:hypothetical protein [Chloroflexota bacterium]
MASIDDQALDVFDVLIVAHGLSSMLTAWILGVTRSMIEAGEGTTHDRPVSR